MNGKDAFILSVYNVVISNQNDELTLYCTRTVGKELVDESLIF